VLKRLLKGLLEEGTGSPTVSDLEDFKDFHLLHLHLHRPLFLIPFQQYISLNSDFTTTYNNQSSTITPHLPSSN
jgi:hypothetical protein